MTALTAHKTYCILTWGCQMNEDDTAQMASLLEERGFEAALEEDAQVIVLNTCSVRAKPEQKVYSKLGQLREVKLRRPELIIAVCGCMAQKEAGNIIRRAPYVDIVVGTGQIHRIPDLVDCVRQERRRIVETGLPDRRERSDQTTPLRTVATGPAKLKSFVSIMYGCDKFCTFCIVPITRGKERSRPAGDIILEVERLASRGVKEVILLGQTVNSYGKFLQEPCSFAQLLGRIDGIEGIERIRFTSPYPRDFTDEVIEAIATLPKVCPQVHLPLQVGDDELLARMHRGYTLEAYRGIVDKLRASVPDLSLTTDLLLGFPGETHKQFENTMRVVEELRYDSAFMFAYSPREGTKAAKMGDQIPWETKRDRLEALIALQNRITVEINTEQLGLVFDVLVEGRSQRDASRWSGQTRQGKVVNFPEGAEHLDLKGATLAVRAVEAHLTGFTGEIANSRRNRGIELSVIAA